MKKEELFRNMSDIDDDLIDEANSRRGKTDVVSPIRITESKRKFNFKPVAAAACCIILAGVVTVVGINYGSSIKKTLLPEGSGTEAVQTQISGSAADNDVLITEETGFMSAKYRYRGDYGEFKDFGGVVCLEFPYYIDTYRTALSLCEIAVVGEFVDVPRQDIDPDDYTEIYPESFHSYNIFRIDRVLKGGTETDKVAVGDEIVIEQDYAVKGGSILSKSKLTPMLKGDRWVYFLNYSDELSVYYPAYDYMSRFPDPYYHHIYNRDPDLKECANRFLPAMTNKYGLTDANDFNQGIFRTLTEILRPEGMDKPAVECLYDAENLALYNVPTFEMAEFEGVVFELRDGCLYIDEPWSSVSQDGTLVVGGNGVSVSKLFITDLNGDKKGEICTEVHAVNSGVDSSFIFVLDYANKQCYSLDGKEGESEYFLAERDGELIAYKTEFTADNGHGSVISDEKLSLDIMLKGGVLTYAM